MGNIDTANLTGAGFSAPNDDDKLMVRLIRLTAAEIASPPARVLFDTINLFKGPDDDVRYYSTGEALVPMDGDGSGASYLGTVADEAAMLALSGVSVGSVCYRTDTGTEWRCIALPSSSLGNWREVAAGGGGGGGGGIPAADITDVLAVNSAGDISQKVVNGVTWTTTFDGDGRPLYDRAFGSTLQRDIGEALGYYTGDASSNIWTPQGVRMSKAQFKAITASLGSTHVGFTAWVYDGCSMTDSAGTTTTSGFSAVWDGAQWIPVTPCSAESWRSTMTYTGAGPSSTLETLTLPMCMWGMQNVLNIEVGASQPGAASGLFILAVTGESQTNTTPVEIGGRMSSATGLLSGVAARVRARGKNSLTAQQSYGTTASGTANGPGPTGGFGSVSSGSNALVRDYAFTVNGNSYADDLTLKLFSPGTNTDATDQVTVHYFSAYFTRH